MSNDYWDKKVEELLQISFENTGNMFKNKAKKAETHPDYQGLEKFNLEVDGVSYVVVVKVSGWIKAKKDGEKWIALKTETMKLVRRDAEVNEKDEQGSGTQEESED